MSTSRRSPGGGVADRIPNPSGIGAPVAGVVSGLVLVLAVFLPWYATNIGPPFSATSASGWSATSLAKVALVMGILVTGAAAAALLDERRIITLDPRHADLLAWVVVVAAAIALLAVGYRLIVMPDPAELLSRQIGIYLAMAGAIGGVLSGLGQIAARH